jgi:hypothetical protein
MNPRNPGLIILESIPVTPRIKHSIICVKGDGPKEEGDDGVVTYKSAHIGEAVYLFRINAPVENGRRVFLDYMRDINRLREHPRFYNTLTTNCTTMILARAAVNPGHIPYSWKVLLSGYTPEYAYDLGRLDRSMPFEELKRRGHINALAQAADKAPDFSQRIRIGLP